MSCFFFATSHAANTWRVATCIQNEVPGIIFVIQTIFKDINFLCQLRWGRYYSFCSWNHHAAAKADDTTHHWRVVCLYTAFFWAVWMCPWYCWVPWLVVAKVYLSFKPMKIYFGILHRTNGQLINSLQLRSTYGKLVINYN